MRRSIGFCCKGLVIIGAVCVWSSSQAAFDSLDPAVIRERIKPVGQVNVAPAPPTAAASQQPNLSPSKVSTSVNPALTAAATLNPTVSISATSPANAASPAASGLVSLAVGEKIFNSKCTVCHTPGLAGAPKVGDVAAWKPRIAKGMDVLLSHVTNGFNAMPPKGTCIECSDTDLKSALEYIVSRAQ